MSELSKADRGDDSDSVKLSELLHGRHSKGMHFSWFVSGIVVTCECICHCCYLVTGFLRFPKVIFYSQVRFSVVVSPYFLLCFFNIRAYHFFFK